MNHILNQYLPFLMKSPFFSLFWVFFRYFLGTFPIRPVSMIPWLMNWIIPWIESAEFFLNWIIFWIESWAKQYWIKYWMNHFLAKFKHWIESDWVSATTTSPWSSGHPGCPGYLSHPGHPHHTHHSPHPGHFGFPSLPFSPCSVVTLVALVQCKGLICLIQLGLVFNWMCMIGKNFTLSYPYQP